MLKTIPAFAALLAATVLIAPTVSQAAEVKSVRVSYADLNLASEPGVRVLEKRLAFAARQVCGPADFLNLQFSQATQECREQAMSDAQPAFHAALAAARNPSVTVLPAIITVTAR